MRKYLIVTLLLVSFTAFSQARLDKPELYIGANFGSNLSMIHFTPSINQSYLQGFNGGLTLRYIAEKNVGMQVELNYSQRGWSETDVKYSHQLNYIEIPFMTHIYIGKKNRFFINFGPKISYLISDKVIENETISSTDIQHATSIQNAFDYGGCGGIGFLFNIKKNIFQLDTRINYSLSDIYSNASSDYFDTSNNVNLSVNFAWLLQVK